MVLITSNLKKYSKLFLSVRIAGNVYYDYVFLDFRQKTMSFYSDSTWVRTDLIIEGENNIDYLYIDGFKFFFLVNSYSSLEIKDGEFYSKEGNRFSLPTIEEDLTFNIEENYSGESKKLKFTKQFLEDLNICKEFLEKTPTYPALFFEKNIMTALCQTKSIQSVTGFEDNTSFSMPTPVLRAILSLEIKEDEIIEFRLTKTENGADNVEFNYLDLFYRFSSSADVTLPVNPFDSNFIKSFNHKNFFVVETKELVEALKIFSTFAKIDVGHCQIIFNSENFINLKLITDSEVDLNLKVIEYSNFDYFDQKDLWISLSGLSSAANSLAKKKVDKIKIHFEEDKPAIKLQNFENKEELFIVQTLIQDPTE